MLLVFLAKGVATALIFPPFSGHDEVMHYAYLKVVAEEGRIPEIPDLMEWRERRLQTRVAQPDFDHAPEELFKYANKPANPKMSFTTADWYGSYEVPVWAITFGGEYLPSGWIYTANHPPLYYLVMTPIYWMVQHLGIDDQIYLFRIATIPFGMLTVLFVYLTIRQIFPTDRFLAILVPAFLAFQPQISYESAMLNNDILAITFTSIVFYLLALGLRRGFPWRLCVITGMVFGLAILSKNTSAVSAAVIAIAMVLGLGIRSAREWIPKGAIVAGVTGSLIWPWYLYMYLTYGDFTALNRIGELQYWNYGGGQGRTIWDQLTDPDFAWWRWNETWGEFGWRLIRLDASLIWLLFYACLIGLVGVGWWALQSFQVSREKFITFRSAAGYLTLPGVVQLESERAPRDVDPIFKSDRATTVAVVTLVLGCVVAYFAILQFGTTFSLTQARYYFPTLPAFTILIMLGYRAMTPLHLQRYVEAAFLIGFFAMNVAIFSVYVIPYWVESI